MIFKYKIHCTSENADKYWFLDNSSPAPTKCPTNSSHIVDLASVAIIDPGQTQEVVTQYEKNDKVLKLYKASAPYDINTGICTLLLKVPGTFTGVDPENCDGRFVAGGYAFADGYKFGDCVTTIQVVDVDNVTGLGVDTVVKEYTDSSADAANQGWYFWASLNGEGEIEIDPIGGYGFLPSGLYLKIVCQRVAGSPATTVNLDIWWGRKE